MVRPDLSKQLLRKQLLQRNESCIANKINRFQRAHGMKVKKRESAVVDHHRPQEGRHHVNYLILLHWDLNCITPSRIARNFYNRKTVSFHEILKSQALYSN
mmetsp:Transcript_53992/g.63120  ORF Transcript_53992/g.63120 Transcript_53992/m.63120 type:complete len:101 (+) Transcript_53992:206-508(+)